MINIQEQRRDLSYSGIFASFIIGQFSNIFDAYRHVLIRLHNIIRNSIIGTV